ncbi:MAG TPA: adenylate/guanylate cyclase domain-containing protein [Candidatus Nitrosocosmicus sp.]|nr:adenylate/guanylate cyclase domain-containing protein [Candidatus Nitrosocosmicus sp.]
MSRNIDLLNGEGILGSEKLFFQTTGQYIAQNSDNQLVLTETYKLPITIVFWDISGFSRLARALYELDQEQIVLEFLEKYYKIARQIITRNNGIWDKAIGDGIMSWFGSFDNSRDKIQPTDEGALDAINAAVELRNSFKSLKEELKNEWICRLSLQEENQPKGKVKSVRTQTARRIFEENNGAQSLAKNKASLFDFDLKCGINTGAARVCLIYNQFTAVGTNVNIASRLQEFAKIDQIVISCSTERKIRDKHFMLRKILINSNNPIKSFEDIDCCYEII